MLSACSPPTLLSEWASPFESFTKSHPLDGCSQHHLMTSTDLGLPLQRLPSYLLTSIVSKTPLKGDEREGCSTFLLVSAPAPETSPPLCCLLTEGTLHIWIGRGIIYPHPWADSGHVHLGRGSLTQKGGCGSCWTSGQKGLDCTDMHLDKLKPGCIVNPQGHLLVPAILSPVGQ